MEDTANKFLQAAMDNLNNYISKTECSWCIGKTQQLIAMLQELLKVGPQAKILSESIDKLQSGNVRGALHDLRQMSGTETSAAPTRSPLLPLSDLKEITPFSPQEPPEPSAPFTGKFQPRVFPGRGSNNDGIRLFNRDKNERSGPMSRLRQRRQDSS